MYSYRVDSWSPRKRMRGLEGGLEADPDEAIEKFLAAVHNGLRSYVHAQGTLTGDGLEIQVVAKRERSARKRGGRRG